LKILADENMPIVEELFSEFGTVERFSGRDLQPTLAQQADILLVRSITTVDEQLLGSHRPQYVGTATIGIDHIDSQFLEKNQIPFSNAPGCNARSVAEYVLATIYSQGVELSSVSAAVIAQGNVGKLVASQLRVLGAQVIVYDPYFDDLEGQIKNLEQIRGCDLLCVHAPMVRDGSHPTQSMLQYSHLSQLAENALVISAGRGGVICEHAIKQLAGERADITWALDVWSNEPHIDTELLGAVDQATPHIAGYSVEGKRMGTYMLYLNCCQRLGRQPREFSDFLQPSRVDWPGSVQKLMMMIYNPMNDDARMRTALALDSSGAAFDQLRKHYPERHEYLNYQVVGAPDEVIDELKVLGFTLDV